MMGKFLFFFILNFRFKIEILLKFSLGLVKGDSWNEKPQKKAEENNVSSQEIEEILQLAKIEQDPFRLFIIINQLANMVKEKDEQISVLERKISENQQAINQL